MTSTQWNLEVGNVCVLWCFIFLTNHRDLRTFHRFSSPSAVDSYSTDIQYKFTCCRRRQCCSYKQNLWKVLFFQICHLSGCFTRRTVLSVSKLLPPGRLFLKFAGWMFSGMCLAGKETCRKCSKRRLASLSLSLNSSFPGQRFTSCCSGGIRWFLCKSSSKSLRLCQFSTVEIKVTFGLLLSKH